MTSRNEAARLWSASKAPLLLNVEEYLSQAEPLDPEPLPHTWDVTSDSIAAWVASRWGADEFVLLKSTGLKPTTDLHKAVRQGLVDVHFPRIAAEVPRIGWCNLLDETMQTQEWLRFGKIVDTPLV